MTMTQMLFEVVLPLAGIAALVLIVKRIVPDTPLTGSGCGGG